MLCTLLLRSTLYHHITGKSEWKYIPHRSNYIHGGYVISWSYNDFDLCECVERCIYEMSFFIVHLRRSSSCCGMFRSFWLIFAWCNAVIITVMSNIPCCLYEWKQADRVFNVRQCNGSVCCHRYSNWANRRLVWSVELSLLFRTVFFCSSILNERMAVHSTGREKVEFIFGVSMTGDW